MAKIVFFLLGVGSLLLADTFTVGTAIEYGLKNSSQIKILKKEREILRAQSFQGRAVVYPQLELGYSDSLRNSPVNKTGQQFASIFPATANVSADDIFPSSLRTQSTYFKAKQLLFSISIFTALKASDATLKLADYLYDDAEAQYILSVRRQFYHYQSSNQILKLHQHLLDQTTQHLADVETKVELDMLAKRDLLNAKVVMLQAKQNLLNSEKNQQLALFELNKILGRRLSNEMTVDQPFRFENKLNQNLSIKKLYKLALENRQAVKAFEEMAKLAGMAEISAKSDSLPSVYYNYRSQNDQYDSDSQTDGTTETQTLSVEWRFFSGGSNLHRNNEKRQAFEKIKEEANVLFSTLEIEIHTAIKEYNNSSERLKLAAEMVSHAKESYKLAKSQFKEGVISSRDVQDAISQKAKGHD